MVRQNVITFNPKCRGCLENQEQARNTPQHPRNILRPPRTTLDGVDPQNTFNYQKKQTKNHQ